MTNSGLSTQKELYVLRTHLWNVNVQKMYDSMKKDLGCKNVWVLFDATHSKPQDCQLLKEETKSRIIFTYEKQCKKDNPLHQSSYYNAETTFMLFDEYVSVDYEFVWFIEYDVRCTSNWLHTLNKCLSMDNKNNHKVDVITPYISTATSSTHPIKPFTDHGILSHCFLQSLFAVTRFSRRFLQFFRNNYYGKLSSYCEVLLTTIAAHHNSEFTMATINEQCLDYFRYRPQLYEEEYEKMDKSENQLVHPVVMDKESTLSNHPVTFFIVTATIIVTAGIATITFYSI